jgi:transposase
MSALPNTAAACHRSVAAVRVVQLAEALTLPSVSIRPRGTHSARPGLLGPAWPALDKLAWVSNQLATATANVEREAAGDPIAQALDRVVGIGPILGLFLRADIGDVTRFADGAHLASYAGLVPLTSCTTLSSPKQRRLRFSCRIADALCRHLGNALTNLTWRSRD